MRIQMLVREVREKKGIKFEILAKKSGISKGTLSKIERNEEEPRLFTIIMIALALKCDISELYKINY